MSPVDLGELMQSLLGEEPDELLVGLQMPDDAAVYKISETQAIVFTADIITPVVDDPFHYGQVAAANSLSDIFAMGGRATVAINICCFPDDRMTREEIGGVLGGGLDRIRACGALLVGGHSVRDKELKYGLAVVGLVDLDQVVRKGGATVGQRLVLTKPVGTGVLIGGYRKGKVTGELLERVVGNMTQLNDGGAEVMRSHGVTGGTDITGFGLAGHSLEMARNGGFGLRFESAQLPHYPESLTLIEEGVKTGVTKANRDNAGADTHFADDVSEAMRTLFFDPQTSGGLLFGVDADKAEDAVATLHAKGYRDAAIVGEVFASDAPRIEVS